MNDGSRNGSGEGAGGMDMGDQAGAVDNRLSIKPSDFPQTENWEDGESYPIAKLGGAMLHQISPGEFEVTPAAGGEPENEQDETAPDSEGAEAAPEYPNPAIARALASPKR